MQIFSKKFFKPLLSVLLVNLCFSSLVFAEAKEPWQGAYTSEAFAGGVIRTLYCDLVGEVEGSFGALTFIIGGIMSLAYAAFGDAKKSYFLVLVGVAGATMSAGISLYFGQMCGGGQGAGGANAKQYIDAPAQLESSEDLF